MFEMGSWELLVEFVWVYILGGGDMDIVWKHEMNEMDWNDFGFEV